MQAPPSYGWIMKNICDGKEVNYGGKDPKRMASFDNSVNGKGSLIHTAAGFGRLKVYLTNSVGGIAP